ncbi:hypothetical protein OHA37_24825 [Streptomyces sp. NBC_00335]|uniref:hypothetical protein n=1 Tax=unclassified Streptomyces TaxID=2593676 RepID=UPI002255689D|nr:MULTISPECIES: hypothetical protein [unclassified Streptomyces]MCX5407078.1 hypothetical protein [Streptomyces sp. NBC_00086]
MGTCGLDLRKTLARSAAAVLAVLTLASCTAGETEAKADHLCDITPSSEEDVLLREILGRGTAPGTDVDAFRTFIPNRTSRLVEKLGRELREMDPAKETFAPSTCTFRPPTRSEGAAFSAGWAPRTSKFVEEPLREAGRFEVNGAFGQSNYFSTKLFVRCDMPGDLAEPSKTAWLYANASYVVNISPTEILPADIDQAAKDRQTTLTYLMTRRVTEALGCENKPLAKPPVVKRLPTP